MAEEQNDKPTKKLRWSLLLLVLATAAGTYGIMWWQERPLVQAEQALAAGDPELSQKLASYYLSQHPDNTRALSVKARALSQLGTEPEEVVRIFELIGPANQEETHAWARAYLVQQQYSVAVPLLKGVLELEPGNAEAQYELVSCLTRLRRFEEAEAAAQALSAIEGYEVQGEFFRGTIYLDMERFDDAASAYAELLDKDKELEGLQVPVHQFYLQYAEALFNAGRVRESLPLVGRSLVLLPTDQCYVLLGDAAEQIGETKRAVESWQTALDANPRNVRAREALANAAIESGDLQRAQELLAPLEVHPKPKSSSTYLIQRYYALVKDDEKTKLWESKTNELSELEKLLGTLNRWVIQHPNSYWAEVIKTHRFAEDGNWAQAELMLDRIQAPPQESEFVDRLVAAIKDRGPLPALNQIPVEQF